MALSGSRICWFRMGKVEAADDLWAQLSQANTEPHRLIKSIDNLITVNNPSTARRICNRMLQRNKRDWEVLLRPGGHRLERGTAQ